jgi:hypothetical protein
MGLSVGGPFLRLSSRFVLTSSLFLRRNQYHKADNRRTFEANKRWEDEKAKNRAAAAAAAK